MKDIETTKKPALIKRVAEIRKSNRTYEPRICPHTGLEFIPTHNKQKYVSRQAQIDHNNDQRAIKNKELNSFTSVLKANREIMRKAYHKLIELKQKAVGKDLLLFSGFDFETYSSQLVNSETGMQVFCSFDYGIEGSDLEKTSFIIHKF